MTYRYFLLGLMVVFPFSFFTQASSPLGFTPQDNVQKSPFRGQAVQSRQVATVPVRPVINNNVPGPGVPTVLPQKKNLVEKPKLPDMRVTLLRTKKGRSKRNRGYAFRRKTPPVRKYLANNRGTHPVAKSSAGL